MKQPNTYSLRLGSLLLALMVLPFTPSFGAGAEKEPEKSPSEKAVASYNEGLSMRDKAADLEASIESATDDKRKADLLKQQAKLFEKAIKHYEAAIDAKPAFAEAHGSLGYAQRRLGRYEEAMVSYDKSLELNPNYPEAMEYRAEALLGLNRLAEAQEAYQKLSSLSPDHATQLLEAMKKWASKDENAAMAAEAKLGDWLSHQAELGAKMLSGAGGSSWN